MNFSNMNLYIQRLRVLLDLTQKFIHLSILFFPIANQMLKHSGQQSFPIAGSQQLVLRAEYTLYMKFPLSYHIANSY